MAVSARCTWASAIVICSPVGPVSSSACAGHLRLGQIVLHLPTVKIGPENHATAIAVVSSVGDTNMTRHSVTSSSNRSDLIFRLDLQFARVNTASCSLCSLWYNVLAYLAGILGFWYQTLSRSATNWQ